MVWTDSHEVLNKNGRYTKMCISFLCVCVSVCLSVCLPVKCGSTHTMWYLGLLVGSVGIDVNREERARGGEKKEEKEKTIL